MVAPPAIVNAVIDALAPSVRYEYCLHASCRDHAWRASSRMRMDAA